jgi:DNA (cytosine-5)-methyltransferase 1
VLDQYRQLGNAVPVGLGEAVGRVLLAHICGERTSTRFPHFQYSRYRCTSHIEWSEKHSPNRRSAQPSLWSA